MQDISPEVRDKIISNLVFLTTALGCAMGIIGISLRVLSGEWPPTAEITDEIMELERVIPELYEWTALLNPSRVEEAKKKFKNLLENLKNLKEEYETAKDKKSWERIAKWAVIIHADIIDILDETILRPYYGREHVS